jgi:hypothetical protein
MGNHAATRSHSFVDAPFAQVHSFPLRAITPQAFHSPRCRGPAYDRASRRRLGCGARSHAMTDLTVRLIQIINGLVVITGIGWRP